jgi:Amt family ammonium transporter
VAERTAALEHRNAELEREIRSRREIEAELVAARDRAEVANHSKSQFLAMMSHELRTPLNAIIGFSEILEAETFGPLGQPRYRSYARDIHTSGSHLLELINELLDLSKIEAGRMELSDDDVELGELVQEVRRLLADRAAEIAVELVADSDGSVPVRADRRALKQALINLASNAVKFTPGGGQVVLRVGVAPDGAPILQVQDQGIGMSPAELEQALTAFGQAEAGRRAGGTGLGLSLTAALAELHGGRMDVDTAPGQGTTVTIRLPAERLQPEAVADA